MIHGVKDTHREIPEESGPDRALAAALSASRQLHSSTEELLDAAAARYGINRNDLRCLEILEREGPMQPGRLAQASGLSPAAITKVLDRLEQAGYITRSDTGSDRRARQVRTSRRHARQRHDLWQPVVDTATAALAHLDHRELETVTAALTALAEANRRSAQLIRQP